MLRQLINRYRELACKLFGHQYEEVHGWKVAWVWCGRCKKCIGVKSRGEY